MAKKRLPPPRRSRSVAQLANGAVAEAFHESFDKFIHSTVKLHPHSRSWLGHFYRAWREQLARVGAEQTMN